MKSKKLVLLASLCLYFIQSSYIVAQTNSSILVGVEYFNGWWEASPNKWEIGGPDWRVAYPDRVPLLGEYNSQETMDKEIIAASYYGVDFFSILYYYGGNLEQQANIFQVQYLNTGLDYFMNSPNADKMKFMIELTNHAPFALETTDDWNNCMDVFIEAMKHPSYLKIDGKAVLKIHGAHAFYTDMDSDITKCNEVLALLRTRALEEGVGELLITMGVSGEGVISDGHYLAVMESIDATMQYMDVPAITQEETDYAYSLLTDQAQDIRTVREDDAIPYVPYFPAGWNPRPWEYDIRPYFSFPTREQWTSSLNTLKTDLENSSNLGFPKSDGTVQKAFTIYAWNEFGEGGIVAPTEGDQFMKLEVIKEVFGEPEVLSGDELVVHKKNNEEVRIPPELVEDIRYEYVEPSITDASGNVYTEVVIGTQTWLVEYLKTTKFNDGTDIPMATSDADYLVKGAAGSVYGWYGNHVIHTSPRGAYYNLTAIKDARGICPEGYRIPNYNTDYVTLVDYLGGASVAGAKLKSDTNWIGSPAGTNDSGFHAVGAGIRLTDTGAVTYEGNAYNWTTTPNGASDNIFFVIPNEGSTTISGGGTNLSGLPCRCIKE